MRPTATGHRVRVVRTGCRSELDLQLAVSAGVTEGCGRKWGSTTNRRFAIRATSPASDSAEGSTIPRCRPPIIGDARHLAAATPGTRAEPTHDSRAPNPLSTRRPAYRLPRRIAIPGPRGRQRPPSAQLASAATAAPVPGTSPSVTKFNDRSRVDRGAFWPLGGRPRFGIGVVDRRLAVLRRRRIPDPSQRRADGKRSMCDTVHPGRAWATKYRRVSTRRSRSPSTSSVI